MKDLNNFQTRALTDFRAIRRHPAFARAVAGGRDAQAIEAGAFFVQALGYCRLWAVDLGESDGTVPATILAPVCRLLAERVERQAESLSALESAIADSNGGVEPLTESNLASHDAIQARMDAWAMYIAIEERVRMLLKSGEEGEEVDGMPFGQYFEKLLTAIEQWDCDLQARGDLLFEIFREANGSHLLGNWRAALAPKYQEFPPWWLDLSFWDGIRKELAIPLPNYFPQRRGA